MTTRRFLAILALLASLTTSSAMAQASKDPIADAMPPPAGIDENGGSDPSYGYVAFVVIAGIAIFAVGKSSRRS